MDKFYFSLRPSNSLLAILKKHIGASTMDRNESKVHPFIHVEETKTRQQIKVGEDVRDKESVVKL
jgi:hypothetical protein